MSTEIKFYFTMLKTMHTSTSVKILKYLQHLMTVFNLNLDLSHQREEETQKIYLIGMKLTLVRTFRNGKSYHSDKLMMLLQLNSNYMEVMLFYLNMQKVAVISQLTTKAKKEMDYKRLMLEYIMVQIKMSI